MPKLVVVGTIEVVPGKRDQVLPFLAAHRDRCRKDEPGTEQFELMLPRDDTTKIYLYEVYRDDAAFEAHRTGASVMQWRKDSAGMVVKLDLTRCTLVD